MRSKFHELSPVEPLRQARTRSEAGGNFTSKLVTYSLEPSVQEGLRKWLVIEPLARSLTSTALFDILKPPTPRPAGTPAGAGEVSSKKATFFHPIFQRQQPASAFIPSKIQNHQSVIINHLFD
jgi:hypothetical protein